MLKMLSNELIIMPYLQGLKLVTPQNAGLIDNMNQVNIGDQFKSSFEVFFMHKNMTIMRVNEMVAETCGQDNPEFMMGKSPHPYFDEASAAFIERCDAHVLTTKQLLVNDYDLIRKDGQISHHLAIRMPIYDDSCNVTGIAGYSVIVGKQSLANFCLEIFKDKFSLQFLSQHESSAFPSLSRREKECLGYLMRGKTMREIALTLNLSVRTIEAYIENLKNKFGVTRKSELLELAFSYQGKR